MGYGIRLAYAHPNSDRLHHRILHIQLHEANFRVLADQSSDLERLPLGHSGSNGGDTTGTGSGNSESLASSVGTSSYYYDQAGASATPVLAESSYARSGRPATAVDLITALANLDRIYVKAKYTTDQTYAE
ncbi:unnamed protein product [Protopolystoma xenopodis]|uniref:Laminin IV type A domain-containing protein n=1 Tax=Protopolystoma xenopodis TaxID=117903 RepID=A0A448WQG7_9PLAT|nr:unnamed protein product [Protopolystoma xenopodis]